MREDILLKVKPEFEANLARSGYILVDLRFYKNQIGALILEILVDRAEGGITLDECTALNRELSAILENDNAPLDFRYTMDVSSPGLDRPLKTAADFRRTQGRDMMVFLNVALEGKVELRGILESVTDEEIHIKTNQKSIAIPLDKVNRAKQVIL
jgi:ribosome maturation factor RimP